MESIHAGKSFPNQLFQGPASRILIIMQDVLFSLDPSKQENGREELSWPRSIKKLVWWLSTSGVYNRVC